MKMKNEAPTSQAEMVRLILNEKGDITAAEIVQAAKERGWEVTVGNANQAKSKWKKSQSTSISPVKTQKTERTADFGGLKSAFRFSIQCGGVENAKKLLDQVADLTGP